MGRDRNTDLPNPFDYWREIRGFIPMTEWRGVAMWYCVHRATFYKLASTQEKDRVPLAWVVSWLRRLLGWHFVIVRMVILSISSRILVAADAERRPNDAGSLDIGIVCQNHRWQRTQGGGRDAFYQSVIDAAREMGLEIHTISIWRKITEFRSILSRIRFGNTSHTPLEIYWRPAFTTEACAWRTGLRAAWEEKRGELQMRDLLRRDIEFRLIPYFLPLSLLFAQMCRRFIRQNRIRLIIVENEGGGWERAMIVAAKLEGIPILALQHGLMTDESPAHMFPKEAIQPEGGYGSPFYQVPEKTGVYGPYYRRLLVEKSAYPPDSVVVTGQPRYDELVGASRTYDRSSFITRYGLQEDTRIVLLLTQPFFFEEDRVELANVTARGVSTSDCTLVVKPHPREKAKFYKSIISLSEQNAVVLGPQSSTSEAMLFSDIIVTAFSTAAIEAAVLGRPVIFVRTRSGSAEDFVRSGLGILVKDENELSETIGRLLHDPDFLANTRSRQQEYLADHLAGVDGKATERVLKVMLEMLEPAT